MVWEIRHICNRCDGTGQIPSDPGPGSEDCSDCGGDGQYLWGYYDGMETKLDALDTKMDTLDTHLDVIEGKIDQLLP